MLVLLIAILANLIGFVTLAMAFVLAGRSGQGFLDGLRTSRGLGILSLGAAGILLALGGQYKLIRAITAPGEQTESLVRLQSLLDEPLDQLRLRVQGADPFQDRRVASGLRLRFRLRSGQEWVSEVPRGRLVPVEADSDDALYKLPWVAVLDGTTTGEARSAAARFQRVGDFRSVDYLAVDVIQRGSRAPPLPDTLLLAPNDRLTPLLFRSDRGGALAVEQRAGPSQPSANLACLVFTGTGPLGTALPLALCQLQAEQPTWVATCDDETSPSLRIATFWQWERVPPRIEIGLLLTVTLGGGGLLIAVGVGLLARDESERLHGSRAAPEPGKAYPS